MEEWRSPPRILNLRTRQVTAQVCVPAVYMLANSPQFTPWLTDLSLHPGYQTSVYTLANIPQFTPWLTALSLHPG